ncbi:MAG: PilZ domain-containing protein [Deltaproteobacteria bacterium]|nr:PilZ domain-containing protein [Deltaproteobacteria bacterium]
MATSPDILIVDADTTTRQELTIVAKACGLTVRVFANAKEALAELKLTIPRLLLTELVLPGIDGFKFCHLIRHDLGYKHLPIVCISSVDWGDVDLAQVLNRRYDALFLPKGSLASELVNMLITLLDIDETEILKNQAIIPESRLGNEEVIRAQELTKEFESIVAIAAQRHKIADTRISKEYRVRYQNLGQFVQEHTGNISRGGAFIYSENPPSLNTIISVAMEIPLLENSLHLNARVVHHCNGPNGSHSGFGVEFIDLSKKDRFALDTLITQLRQMQQRGSKESNINWIVLCGLKVEPFINHPTFVGRKEFEFISCESLIDAMDILTIRDVRTCIVGEPALAIHEPFAALERLGSVLRPGAQRILITNRQDLHEALTRGLCENIIDSSQNIDYLICHIDCCHDIPMRKSIRVSYDAPVNIVYKGQAKKARLRDISCGGARLVIVGTLEKDTKITIAFRLKDQIEIICQALVAWSTPDYNNSSEIGVTFTDLDEASITAIRDFVQNHIQE